MFENFLLFLEKWSVHFVVQEAEAEKHLNVLGVLVNGMGSKMWFVFQGLSGIGQR